MIIKLKPGNKFSALSVFPYKKKGGERPLISKVDRKKVDYSGRIYASYRNSKLRNARILAWNSIKNQPVVHLSVILSAFRFAVDTQIGDPASFKHELKVVQRRLRKIKTLFQATFKDCYLLYVVEISNLDIIHVHLLSNIASGQVGLFWSGIVKILGSVVEDYEAKARGHKAIFSAPFVPVQIPYLAASKKLRETARILAIMGGKHSMGIINEKAVVYHESTEISATSDQLESIKRYISFILQENRKMSNTSNLNNHQALNIANNHFTQHAMTSDQVEEVMARSEEIFEGHYDSASLMAIKIREVLGPDSPYPNEYSEEYQTAEKARIKKIKERNMLIAE